MKLLRTTRPAVIFAFLWMAWGFAAPLVTAGDNYAFLVAVGDYDVKQLKPLAYTRNDVLEFSKALTDSGFKSENIVLMHDDLKTLKSQRYLPSAEKIRKQFDLLLSSVDDGDSVIVAFAGHGVQFEGDDRNFFCPVDADLEDPKRERLISLKEIYTKLEECSADRKLLLVDACRNDPQSKLGRSREKVKLNSVTRPQMEAVPKGIVALFSCSAGQESYEWPDLEHGVFFHQILSGWKGAADTGDQELSLDELVAYTRKNTQTFARLKLDAIQTPQLKGEFNGTWVLRKLSSVKEFTNSIGMTLKLIPAGEFDMGSHQSKQELVTLFAKWNATESDFDDEFPRHRVKISQPFYMGSLEVTQAEYESVMGTNPSSFSKTGSSEDVVSSLDTSKFPVEKVSWYDAIEFCNKLSLKDGRSAWYTLTNVQRENGSIKSATVSLASGGRQSPESSGYRLPTEAEWEYACRAGTTSAYHSGNTIASLDQAGWWGAYATPAGNSENRTNRVGQKTSNAFGLFDMHGNVYEWCEDVYDQTAYAGRSGTTVDPKVTSGSEYRVLRGGSWFNAPWVSRSANRNWSTPDDRNYNTGFRVVSVSVGVRTK